VKKLQEHFAVTTIQNENRSRLVQLNGEKVKIQVNELMKRHELKRRLKMWCSDTGGQYKAFQMRGAATEKMRSLLSQWSSNSAMSLPQRA